MMSPRSRDVEDTTTGAPPIRPRAISPLRVAADGMRLRLPGWAAGQLVAPIRIIEIELIKDRYKGRDDSILNHPYFTVTARIFTNHPRLETVR
ncbi:hypothetical protein GCM10011612_10460 [Actinomyces gaoshouyii]|uniref:Uncharacterized protein n=1 Tax=Actinomyces gaoshouyii TaxID=1960083 RepID=A0A8H9H8V4_9ACTO|nr:hypothetical protein GCM10011612_10460 [Actinomyces gaoshouyii]